MLQPRPGVCRASEYWENRENRGQPLKVEYDGNGGIYVFVEGWRGDQEY